MIVGVYQEVLAVQKGPQVNVCVWRSSTVRSLNKAVQQ